MSGGISARPGWVIVEGLGYLHLDEMRLDLFRQVSSRGRYYDVAPGPAVRSVRRAIRADAHLAMTERGLPGLTVYGWRWMGHRSNPATCDLVVERLGAAALAST